MGEENDYEELARRMQETEQDMIKDQEIQRLQVDLLAQASYAKMKANGWQHGCPFCIGSVVSYKAGKAENENHPNFTKLATFIFPQIS